MVVEILSRIQFAFSIGFHILFPTLNLGLALFLVCMEAAWLCTDNPLYLKICKFWVKIFALTFGMGVVSGIVLAYQIGTNFGPFISQFGNVLGALFAYETLTAFFLEAGFLGVMLFGWKRVPPPIHFTATLLVGIGTTISAFWIMSANSWMQTPSGYEWIDGKYLVHDWWHIVFNPSFLARMFHMLFASYTTTCFVIAGIASYFLLKGKHDEVARKSLSVAMWAALFLVPAQIVIGDTVGLNVHKYQPLKTAAIEGVWETQKGAPLILFAWPSQEKQKNEYVISIPKLASLINTHHWDGELLGLRSVPRDAQPFVAPVFFSFRIMVGIGVLMLVTALLALFLRPGQKLFNARWFQCWSLIMAPLGFVAAITGWLTAEVGRQPWVVYYLMRTSEAVSAIDKEEVIISFILLVLAYGIIFSFYLYYLFKTIRLGPERAEEKEVEHHIFQYMTDHSGDKK
ncbi:cytochrome ubiquinol oxidase subunit I [Legionella oakridgensis]|uniref:Cytochrome bd-type quinol oxidase, subunit 1 n=2 Tax=Legionella oakridgensis TaxID=29423 RepID=W0BC00_9GAMM|nr:cytochrome ubiquinol oxidase subunit I [Legionella oakridgensis]AHE67365.1 cytochrome bd-type quinol oxidase, subunit 1 [Legionella oakridgensis ATCC 33761 = DSM 21215]ETO93028.1 cytochrome bd-I ubiquinol oxidase, subunit 1 apoprotein [Legionella oakridgensis RV-2-2007]KTD43435.1 cytochrome d ubiquinol oxidase subunit I [Legionella oakridgensis]STY20426.1 cytochrome d ubiquinol oxidase subunit I [Legionella longbeachae]